jgi:class 3 adenylate cyclase/pimeloyl-ACP methyl ester carboxylesterase
MTPLFVESFSLHHLVPEVGAFLSELSRARTVVLYDGRGNGLSQRDVGFPSQANLLDMKSVIAATGGKSVAIWANFTYTMSAIRLAAEHPELVERLVLFAAGAYPPTTFPDEVIHSFVELVKVNWPLASQTFGDMSTREADPLAGLRWGELYRQSTSGESVAAAFSASLADETLDVRSELGNVKAPTLVLHRKGDLNVPLEMGQEVAAGIPGAVFIPLDGVITSYALGDQQSVLRAALPFLGGEQPDPSVETATGPPSVFRIVLFTDMVGSSALSQRLGDAKLHEIRRAHNKIVRDALAAHGGAEIKHTGDGIMASFGSTSAALQCAINIQRRVAERGDSRLAAHIGVNAGEPISDEQDLFGTSVDLARRVCDEASGGEILVPDVVRQLAAGKDFLFSDRGVADLKGFDEPVRLFEVRWRDVPLAE